MVVSTEAQQRQRRRASVALLAWSLSLCHALGMFIFVAAAYVVKDADLAVFAIGSVVLVASWLLVNVAQFTAFFFMRNALGMQDLFLTSFLSVSPILGAVLSPSVINQSAFDLRQQGLPISLGSLAAAAWAIPVVACVCLWGLATLSPSAVVTTTLDEAVVVAGFAAIFFVPQVLRLVIVFRLRRAFDVWVANCTRFGWTSLETSAAA